MVCCHIIIWTVEGEVLRGLTINERNELVVLLLRRALSAAPPQSPWRAGVTC
jgi:hypothetical protein